VLAEANGLTGSEALTVGTTLIVPGGVSSAHNTSETFAVYDPNKAMGANDPTTMAQIAPPAKKHGGCGIVGKILIIAIAVAVAAVIGPEVIAGFQAAFAGLGAAAATVAGAVVGGAVTGAISSVVSQGFGVATGIQDKFSWKGVAMSALAGGIGAGVGQLGSLKGLSGLAGKGFVAGAARSVISNVATQGVAVATGLQKKFDWAGVAVAGVVGGVSAEVDSRIGGGAKYATDGSMLKAPSVIHEALGGAAGGLAGAATRSLLTGTSFAKNLEAVLPDAIGATIGNSVVNAIKASNGLTQRAKGFASALDEAEGIASTDPNSLAGNPEKFAEVRASLKAFEQAAPRMSIEQFDEAREALILNYAHNKAHAQEGLDDLVAPAAPRRTSHAAQGGGADPAAVDGADPANQEKTVEDIVVEGHRGAVEPGVALGIRLADHDNDANSSSNTLWTSNYYYDGSGHLSSVSIADGRPRTVSFVTDASDQVLQRHEADNLPATNGDPHEFHHYFNGMKIGDVGNNGTSDVDYVASYNVHISTPGTGQERLDRSHPLRRLRPELRPDRDTRRPRAAPGPTTRERPSSRPPTAAGAPSSGLALHRFLEQGERLGVARLGAGGGDPVEGLALDGAGHPAAHVGHDEAVRAGLGDLAEPFGRGCSLFELGGNDRDGDLPVAVRGRPLAALAAGGILARGHGLADIGAGFRLAEQLADRIVGRAALGVAGQDVGSLLGLLRRTAPAAAGQGAAGEGDERKSGECRRSIHGCSSGRSAPSAGPSGRAVQPPGDLVTERPEERWDGTVSTCRPMVRSLRRARHCLQPGAPHRQVAMAGTAWRR
jgi:hypothetical protein